MNEIDQRILLATGNPHKREELRAIFDVCAGGRAEVELVSLDELETQVDEPVEDGPTFEANAIKKAQHYAAATGMLCMADDSGLEVDALNGEPGVRSARYSGATGARAEVDLANNRRLLKRLGDTPPVSRSARFVCAMALTAPAEMEGRGRLREIAEQMLPLDADSGTQKHVLAPDRHGRLLALVRGTIEGRILLPAETADRRQPECGRGTNGFGYDPLFLVPDLGCTTAELTPEHKNRISHRGDAARAMYEKLAELGVVVAAH